MHNQQVSHWQEQQRFEAEIIHAPSAFDGCDLSLIALVRGNAASNPLLGSDSLTIALLGLDQNDTKEQLTSFIVMSLSSV